MRTGSASIRHSHNDQREGRIVENALRGDELGSDARIYRSATASHTRSSSRRTGEGALGRGRETVLLTWGASLESGSLAFRT